jgi:cytochrome c biogenesis protein CcdA
MQISPEAFWVILGMAVVTYATRAGGLWIVQRFTLSEKVKIWSEYIPGTVLVSIGRRWIARNSGSDRHHPRRLENSRFTLGNGNWGCLCMGNAIAAQLGKSHASAMLIN